MFCKIANGEIESAVVHKDADVVAFEDIKPGAPVHIIVIPTRHIERVSDIRESDAGLTGKLILIAAELARKRGIERSGYRLVINCGENAGQVVPHLHLHLLGGRKFAWPPG